MAINRDGDNANQNQNKNADQRTSAVIGDDFSRTSGAQKPVGGHVNSNDHQQNTQRKSGGLLAAISRATGNSSRRLPGADLQKLEKVFGEKINSSSFRTYEDASYKVLALGPDVLGLNLSVLLFTLPITDPEGRPTTTVYTLIVDDGRELPDHTIPAGPKTYRYSTVVGEAFTPELWARISTHLQNSAGRQLTLLSAGSMVLPAGFDLEDQDLVFRTCFFASEAIFRLTEEVVFQSTQDVVSISDIGQADLLKTKIDFSDLNGMTATGLPLRQDIRVILGLEQAQQAGHQNPLAAFQTDSATVISEVSCFIDISYREPEPPQWGQPPRTQHYTPRAVITRMDTGLPVITPEIQMLGLITAPLLSKKLLWARTWSNSLRDHSRGAKEVYLRDIGAIGYDVSPTGEPQKIPTNTEAFDDGALAKLVMATISDDLVISMDVEENGELSWLNKMYLDAARGVEGADANLVVVADNLTNGLFSQIWNNVPHDQRWIVEDDQNRIALGYYTGSAGGREDLRGLDYLAVLNLFGDRADNLPAAWQATFDNLDEDEVVRLAQREELIRRILPSAVITGYAQRVNFNPIFLDALTAAAAQAGLKIRPDNAQLGFGQRQQRGRMNMGRLGLSNARNVGGVYQQVATGNTGGGRGAFGAPLMGGFTRR